MNCLKLIKEFLCPDDLTMFLQNHSSIKIITTHLITFKYKRYMEISDAIYSSFHLQNIATHTDLTKSAPPHYFKEH